MYEQFMSYNTFCVHRGGNIIDSPRNIGLIRLIISFIKTTKVSKNSFKRQQMTDAIAMMCALDIRLIISVEASEI